MHEHEQFLFKIWAASVAVFIVAAGLHLTIRFALAEKLYPVDLTKLTHEETARRSRTELEEESSRTRREGEKDEEEDEDTKDNTPGANPFVPNLQSVPDVTLPADAVEPMLAKKFDERNIKVKAFSDDPTGVTGAELTHCKSVIEQTLSVLPANLTASLDDLTLYFNNTHEPRGLSNSHVLELKCGGLADREIAAVLVHELGHITDLGAFTGTTTTPSNFTDGSLPVALDDASVQFYSISWQNSKTQKFSATRDDFVSGYAMSDPFEDFAESFITYVLHGDDFRTMAESNDALAKKYTFLRDTVFSGTEYTGARKMVDGKRVWDVTLVDYDLTQFFKQQNIATNGTIEKVASR